MEYVVLLIIIAVILFFGPRYVPQLMNAIGRAKGELTRGKLTVEKELQEDFPDQQQQPQK
jgi:Sec-independent protein translocase protein TatA